MQGFSSYSRIGVQQQQLHKGFRVSGPRANCPQVNYAARVAREQPRAAKMSADSGDGGVTKSQEAQTETETEEAFVYPRGLSGLPWLWRGEWPAHTCGLMSQFCSENFYIR